MMLRRSLRRDGPRREMPPPQASQSLPVSVSWLSISLARRSLGLPLTIALAHSVQKKGNARMSELRLGEDMPEHATPR